MNNNIDLFYIDYIKAIENPDKIGWNGKIWTAPTLKGYDRNLRGYGIDINKNIAAKKLTEGRPGKWLSEKEADDLMKEHIKYIYDAAQKHIQGFDTLPILRKAALLGMLYRGDSVNKNKDIINIMEPDDTIFFNSISNYYKTKGLNERAKNSDNFFSKNKFIKQQSYWNNIPLWNPPMLFKKGGQVRKMQTAAGGPIHYSRTMTSDNLSKAANYVGGYVLKGLGALGKFLNAGFTSPTYGTTGQISYARNAEDAKRLRKQSEASEQALGKAMTWVSPLNYGAALVTGNGLNAKKGEEEVASWSPAWLAAARLGELYVGPKVVKGVKATPRAVVNTAAKAGVKPAKKVVVARELNKNIQNSELLVPLRYITKNYTTNDKGNVSTVSYQLIDPIFGQPLGNAVISGRLINNGKGRPVGWIESLNKAKGVSEDIYNTAVLDALLLGELGIESGWDLMEPNKTLAVTKKFPHEVIGESEGHPVRLLTGVTNKQKPLTIDFSNHILFLNDNIKFNLATGQFEEIKPIIDGNKLSLKFFERKPARITEAERAGVPKLERNFTPKRHIAYYPGYQLKGLMKGSLLEKQLSKNGTININLLNAYFNKASQIEKEVANKVLAEKFAGLKTIDYNLFKKAVLDELITYNRKPLTKYSDYGADRLGLDSYNLPANFTDYFKLLQETFPDRFVKEGNVGLFDKKLLTSVNPWNIHDYDILFKGIRGRVNMNTFTFESPRIPAGSAKHYDTSTLGHSRTYITPDEPKVLHVMESLSDWGQSHVKMMPSVQAHQIAIEKALKSGNTTAFHSFTNRFASLIRDKLTKYEQMALENINKEIESGQPSGFLTIDELWNKKYEILKKAGNRSNIGVLGLHLHDNYLQRLLQENLKYAAENGLTKMRYPTSETAAKIEGYLKVNHTLLNELSNLQMKLGELFENGEISWEEYDKMIDAINKLKKELFGKEYDPKHQTILKKYADFPKLFLKLFKDLQVRTVTDAKGNTWYEVDVPKGYLSREWQFKQGGKMNILEFLKNGSGIHIKEKNKGSFTRWCGGNVTEECIRRGKNSSNPKIRKKATFADNARHFKHKKGGKAFVEGVNVLDSNPKAYKYVKKKYKMRSALLGTKLLKFGSEINNFMSSDLGKGLLNIAGQAYNSIKGNQAINKMEEANAALFKANKLEAFNNRYKELLSLQNNLPSLDLNGNIVNHSDIEARNNAYTQAMSSTNYSNAQLNYLDTQNYLNDYRSLINNGLIDSVKEVLPIATNALSKNGVPSDKLKLTYFNVKKFGLV